jgi:hypothetical protein
VRLVAYLRTSTNGGSGDSLAAQEDACREWATERGHDVVLNAMRCCQAGIIAVPLMRRFSS